MLDPPRVLFYGSPDFAVPTLQALIDSPYRPIAVVTQPDARAGRGRALRPQPIKLLAAQHQIPAIQPLRLRDRAAIAQIASLRPQLQIVAAYGQLIPKAILDLPEHGTLNVHASLLPRWRGASPISAAILHGDVETGASIMLVDETEDTGHILRQSTTAISATEHAGQLSERLAQLGADLLLETIPDWLDQAISPIPQDVSQARRARRISKAHGRIDWSQTAVQIARHIRAYTPWPAASTTLDGQPIRIAEATASDQPVDSSAHSGPPGRVVEISQSIVVVCGEGMLQIHRLQRAGKRELHATEFARGIPDLLHHRFGAPDA